MANWPMLGAIALPNIGGWIGGAIVTKDAIKWYEKLVLPKWRPPNWVFGPVWTGLYCSMGYASYLVYKDGGGFDGQAKMPLMLFSAQLACNWAWTPLFFGMHRIGTALADIFLVLGGATATAAAFWPINRGAGIMFLPYIAWVGFATLLNYRIWKDNKDSRPKTE